MTQDACLTLKTLEAALSTMRPACVKVSNKLINHNLCTFANECFIKGVCWYVCFVCYSSRWWVRRRWRQRWGISLSLYKSSRLCFCCLSFSVFTHSHTQITRALSSLKHHLTCPASLGESSWYWCCKLGLFLPCGSSKRKTAPMKLCEQYAFIKCVIYAVCRACTCRVICSVDQWLFPPSLTVINLSEKRSRERERKLQN